MAHTIKLNERTRAAMTYRLNSVGSSDVPTYRRLARAFDALKLDELPDDAAARFNAPHATWDPVAREYELTSAVRDDLIAWMEPTERAPLNGYMARLLMPVYDALKEGRDGTTVPQEATP